MNSGPSERHLWRLLRRCEHSIGLLWHCQPLEAEREISRVTESWSRGVRAAPRWVYPPRVDLSEVESLLSRIAESNVGDSLFDLYRERATELLLEAELVGEVGRRRFLELARRRFDPEPPQREEALALADAWTRPGSTPANGEVPVRSDDPAEPNSLLCLLQRTIGERRLPIRIQVTAHLSALAATGEGTIWIAAERRLSPAVAERIVVHELEGHALPRLRAERQACSIFRVASARGNDEQEGWALVNEQLTGHLGPLRRRELGLRHLAAAWMYQGADFCDTVSGLIERAEPIHEAIRIAARAHRGGGLGREIAYLPAYLRVERALAEDAELADWYAAGRVDRRAITALRAAGVEVVRGAF